MYRLSFVLVVVFLIAIAVAVFFFPAISSLARRMRRMMRRLGPSDYVEMRWKNGGGTTTEILVEPPGAARFAWRVSAADVGASGPFSSFPGYERHIVVIEGEGMTLACGEHGRIDLEPFSPRTFSGDWSVDGRLVAGPVRDLNLIVDRAWGTGSLEVARIDAPLALLPGGTLLVHVLSGDLADLPAHHTLVADEGVELVPRAAGRIAIVRVRPV